MLDPLPITPFTKPPAGDITLPGSKSITNRALILAALSPDTIICHNALFSDDTRVMIDALEALGFFVSANPSAGTISVEGRGGSIPIAEADIFLGNAGTVARFLPPFLALNPEGRYYLDGSPAMRKRPIEPLISALESLNAVNAIYHQQLHRFPFTIETKGLNGGAVTVDTTQSSQFLSGLLMVAPFAYAPLAIRYSPDTVSFPMIDLTLQMMREFGIETPSPTNHTIEFSHLHHAPYKNAPENYTIEPDATAASYFHALNYITNGQVVIAGLEESKQGDNVFKDLLASNPERMGITHNFASISDTFLTLAAIAPLLKGPTTLTGIAHTRLQESDRVRAMATELRKLGQNVTETEDALTILPQPLTSGVEIDTYEDHRMAMSFAILGSYDLNNDGSPWLYIKNPQCCSKSFPNFFEILNKVHHNG